MFSLLVVVLPLLLSTALLRGLSPRYTECIVCLCVCACVCRCVSDLSVFSAQSLSSQRRNWEESIAWSWALGSLRPVPNPHPLPGQMSPWSHWRALSSSGRCPGRAEEGASRSPRRVPGRGPTGAPVPREGPQRCRAGSSSSCAVARPARSGWGSGFGSAGCRRARRSRRTSTWCCAAGWPPARSTPPPSGAGGRPARSKGGGGAGGRCGPACRRCGTASAASNTDRGSPGSPSSCCNHRCRRRRCPPSLCHRCPPSPRG